MGKNNFLDVFTQPWTLTLTPIQGQIWSPDPKLQQKIALQILS